MSSVKCPYCGGNARLKSASEVHNKPHYEGKMWVCENFPSCDSYVGCHENTTIPLGRLANKRLRLLKKEAHLWFDPIWKSGLMTRKDAYRWLADMLHIPCEECHVGMFDVKQCQKTIYLCKKQNNPVITSYREQKYFNKSNYKKRQNIKH